MNNLITFGIPTYNRQDLLDEALHYFYYELKLEDYQLLVSDNGSTDNTEIVVKKYSQKFSNLKYFKHPHNIGADNNGMFLQKQNNSDYFMFLGDGVRMNPEIMNSIIEILKSKKYDVVCFDYNNRTKGIYPTCEYTNKDKFLSEIGWYITQLSSYIISKKLIDKTNSLLYLYNGSYFNSYKRIFDYAAKYSFMFYWISCDSMYFSKIPKHNSWSKQKSEVWFGDYVNTILSLPASYSLKAKYACLKEASKYSFFNKETILNDILNDILDEDDFHDFEMGIKIILGDDKYYKYLRFCKYSKFKQKAIIKLYNIPRQFNDLRTKLAIRTRIKNLLRNL